MPTLTEFLLARIAEDEAVLDVADYVNHRRFGTTRLLAECEAKRRIVERYEYRWGEAERAEAQHLHGMFASQATGLRNALGFMAAVYADHPDYDPDWRA